MTESKTDQHGRRLETTIKSKSKTDLRNRPREWEPETEVEAYHPMRHRVNEWEPATVVKTIDWYVRVRWADGGEAVTYHLNVRLPGEPDPVRDA